MTPLFFLHGVIQPAWRHMLPVRMQSVEAESMIIAICLQESNLQERVQGHGGPAHSFAQFERGGIRGVLEHPTSKNFAADVCKVLCVEPTVDSIYEAITYNDALTVCFARLLLWTLPQALPSRGDKAEGWEQYTLAWRPGKPHPESWPSNFGLAERCVYGGVSV